MSMLRADEVAYPSEVYILTNIVSPSSKALAFTEKTQLVSFVFLVAISLLA